MAEFITIPELRTALNAIYKYIKTGERQLLIDAKPEILLAKEIDNSIKTKKEYETNSEFIEDSHGPARMAVFLLNHYGELYVDGGILSIYDDDQNSAVASHKNTYKLKLKDRDTHMKIYKGNPTAEEKPYDFNTIFLNQLTFYVGKDTPDDTTKTAWDSFAKSYTTPTRTLDFKSAFWNVAKGKDTHAVNYIIQLTFDRQLKVFSNGFSRVEKKIEFKTTNPNAELLLDRYYSVIDCLESISNYSWDNFILPDEN